MAFFIKKAEQNSSLIAEHLKSENQLPSELNVGLCHHAADGNLDGVTDSITNGKL